MTNSMKVPLKNGSGSGSTGFLRDAPRTSLTPEDPVLVTRGSLVDYLRALQHYRGRSGLTSVKPRQKQQYLPVHLVHLYHGHPSEAFFYHGVLR